MHLLKSVYRHHRVAMADFWRTFYHDGKISPGWYGGAPVPTPFQPIAITSKVLVYAPAQGADTRPLFHLFPICTLFSSHLPFTFFKSIVLSSLLHAEYSPHHTTHFINNKV